MAVSVETLSGLKRRVTVSVPAKSIEEEVGLRLQNLVHRVKVHGFRPGKAPLHVVKQRYADGVRDEVAREMVQATLYDALNANDLVPAGTPAIEPGLIAANQDFVFTASFEVFPEFTIKELSQSEIELGKATVTDKDVDALVEKLREQQKTWTEVKRAVKKGDRVRIDFEGFIDGESMQNGKETGYQCIIGDGQMIKGFESGLIGAKLSAPLELNLTFPTDYHEKSLADKPARFEVIVQAIEEGTLPPLDDAFASLYNITEGGIPALLKDIKSNMERELERRLSSMNRETIFSALLKENPFDLPESLIEREIGHLRHEMYHRIFGHEHSDSEKIPDFPRVLFEEQAMRRVHLGILFADYVKNHKLAVDQGRVDAMIEKLCAAYDDPDGLRAWYAEKQERMAEIEALVMEEMVAEKIIENVKVKKKTMSYDDVMVPNKPAKMDDEEKN